MSVIKIPHSIRKIYLLPKFLHFRVLMDDKTQKERLEQELRFLKESFEAEVISKEEYEKGIDRIEKKLREIEEVIRTSAKEQIIEERTQEIIKPEEQKKDTAVEGQESNATEQISRSQLSEKIKLEVIQDEIEEHEHFGAIQPAEKERDTSAFQEPKTIIEEQKNESKFYRYAVIFVVLALVLFFSYSLLTGKKSAQEKTSQLNFVAACASDDDCRQEGKEGICLERGTKDAKCEFKEAQKTNVIVLNDRKDCFNCDTRRVLNILESWFGAINAKEIGYNTDEGRNLADRLDAKILPFYIMDENITKKPKFGEFKQIFIKKHNDYVLSENAAGSTFYFKRDNMQNKLDLFAIAGDDASVKAEKNLRKFLDAFQEVNFEKHLSSDKLTEELGIKTFPAFLVNNKVKFSGVLAAETIKENFCKLNKVPGCEKSLSKSLV